MVLVVALYVFVRTRLVSRLPVMEITESRLRWRKPGNALFSSVRLDDIVALHWSESALVIIVRAGTRYSVPLKDLHFREGSYAVSILHDELDLLIDTGRNTPNDRRNTYDSITSRP